MVDGPPQPLHCWHKLAVQEKPRGHLCPCSMLGVHLYLFELIAKPGPMALEGWSITPCHRNQVPVGMTCVDNTPIAYLWTRHLGCSENTLGTSYRRVRCIRPYFDHPLKRVWYYTSKPVEDFAVVHQLSKITAKRRQDETPPDELVELLLNFQLPGILVRFPSHVGPGTTIMPPPPWRGSAISPKCTDLWDSLMIM